MINPSNHPDISIIGSTILAIMWDPRDGITYCPEPYFGDTVEDLVKDIENGEFKNFAILSVWRFTPNAYPVYDEMLVDVSSQVANFISEESFHALNEQQRVWVNKNRK